MIIFSASILTTVVSFVHAYYLFRIGPELIDRTRERLIIAPGKGDAKAFCEQLTAGLEPQAAVRAGDERDAYAGRCHRQILVGGHQTPIYEFSSQAQSNLSV